MPMNADSGKSGRSPAKARDKGVAAGDQAPPQQRTVESMQGGSVQRDEAPAAAAGDKTPQGKAAAPAEDGTREQIEKLTRLANEHWEKFVRAQAEVENIRKRSARDIEKARIYGIEKWVLEILAVKDSLELGLQEAGDDKAKLHEGMALTLKMLDRIFAKFEIEEISPQGEVFNPDRHEAMLTRSDGGHAPGTVIEVMQKGYSLSGRLIRPARVSVAGKDTPKTD